MSNQRVRVTVEFDIDTERCRLYGVTPREVFQSLQADMSDEFDGATIYTNYHKLNTCSDFVLGTEAKIISKEYMGENIINATFVSVWDGGTAIETECKINTITREVFDIIPVEADVDTFERQYVIIDGQEYDVVCVDGADEVGESEYWFE